MKLTPEQVEKIHTDSHRFRDILQESYGRADFAETCAEAHLLSPMPTANEHYDIFCCSGSKAGQLILVSHLVAALVEACVKDTGLPYMNAFGVILGDILAIIERTKPHP